MEIFIYYKSFSNNTAPKFQFDYTLNPIIQIALNYRQMGIVVPSMGDVGTLHLGEEGIVISQLHHPHAPTIQRSKQQAAKNTTGCLMRAKVLF